MKKIQLYITAFILLLAVGCDNFLDVDQPDVVEDENAFKTYNEGLVAIIGCYQGIQEAVDQLFLLANLRTDLILPNDNAPAYFKELSEGIYSASNPYLDASPFYRIINQTNDVLSNMDKLQANDPENVDENIVAKFKAEVTVIRALSYLYIMQNFDKIYYYENSLTEYDPSLTIEPTPKAAVIDTLTSQLEYYLYQKDVGNFVIEDQISGNYKWYKFRFGEDSSVRQLLAELYMEGMNYSRAFEELHQIIDLDDPLNRVDRFSMSSLYGFNKWKNIFESYATSYTTNNEMLLTVPFYKRNDQTYNVQYWCSNAADGVYYLKPSNVAISYFASQGEDGDIYRGEGITYDFENGEPIISKYLINVGLYDYDNSFILFRAGDSWLDACEALNHIGSPADALELMNTGYYQEQQIKDVSLGVRGRVGLAPLYIKDFDPVKTKIDLGELITREDSIKAVDMAILDERAREEAYETSRFYDLRRISEYWNDPTIISDIISSKYKGVDEAKVEIIKQRFLNPANWYITTD
ncbi:MAG: RagB/SusD family nutrient uptake outer membrane protein [Draconibacterium sp.]